MLGVTNLLAPLSAVNAEDALTWSEVESRSTAKTLRAKSFKFIMPAHDVFLYAITEPNTYHVRYNKYDNRATWTMEISDYVYDTNTGTLRNNEYHLTWYTFSKWNTWSDLNGTDYEQWANVHNWRTDTWTTDVYAKWTANKYNIHYDLNPWTWTSTPNSGASHPTEVEYDSGFTVSNPSRTWYTFSGWDISDMDTTEHLIGTETGSTETAFTKAESFKNLRANNEKTVQFKAQWIADQIRYKVTHNLETLSGGAYVQTGEAESFSWAADSIQTPAEKTFEWFEPNAATTPTGAAIWTVNDYKTFVYQYNRKLVNFVLSAGTWVASATASGTVSTPALTVNEKSTGNKDFKYDEPLKLTFTLKTWYTGGTWDGSSSFNMPSTPTSRTVTATPIVYTVTWIYHGWTGEAPNVDVYSKTYTVESGDFYLPNSLTRPHSVFSWWIQNVGDTPSKTVKIASWSHTDYQYEAVYDCVPWYKYHDNTPQEECVPEENTPYKVEHYQQQLNGSYTIVKTDNPTGTTDTDAIWTWKTYIWFSGWYLSGTAQKIKWDKSTVVQVRYDRNSYNRTITPTTWVTVETTQAAHSPANGPYLYEDTVTIKATTGAWYTFTNWTVTDASGSVDVADANALTTTFQMPAGPVTIKANVTLNEYNITYNLNSGSVSWNPANYTVESENIILNNPTRDHSVFLWWTWTDHTELFSWNVVAIAKWSTWPKSFVANWWCGAWYHAEGNSCVANTYTVTINYMDGGNDGTTASGTKIETFTYDQVKEIPNPTQDWYTFAWWTITWMSGNVEHQIWSPTNKTTESGATSVLWTGFMNLTTVENGDVTFTATWTANTNTKYEVHYMLEELDGKYMESWALAQTDLSGTTNAELTLNNLERYELSGFTYTGWALESSQSLPSPLVTTTNIAKDGTTKIYLYYSRRSFEVFLNGNHNVVLSGAGKYTYGEDVTVTATPATWYHFVRWEKRSSKTDLWLSE